MNAKHSVNQGSKRYFEFLFKKEKTHHRKSTLTSLLVQTFPLHRNGAKKTVNQVNSLLPHLGYDISSQGHSFLAVSIYNPPVVPRGMLDKAN